MNASGRPNTCKSRGIVAILETGRRVRNAYATYLLHGDSSAKVELIPDRFIKSHGLINKDLSVIDGHA